MVNKLPINSIDDLIKIGQLIESSCMFGASQTGQGFVIASTCYQRNIDLANFNMTYNLIGSHFAMSADAMLAKFHERDGTHEILSRTPEKASIVLTKNGQESVFNYTWEQAQDESYVWSKGKKSNGLKTTYAHPRNRMQCLWARVVSDAIRAIDPGVNYGCYTPEEVKDFDGVDVAEIKDRSNEEKTVEDKAVPMPFSETEKNHPAPEAKSIPPPALDIDFSVVPEFFVKGKKAKVTGKKWDDLNLESLQYFVVHKDKFDFINELYLSIIENVIKEKEEKQ